MAGNSETGHAINVSNLQSLNNSLPALAVKEYVKAAFGTKHQYYKDIKGLKFVRIAYDPNA